MVHSRGFPPWFFFQTVVKEEEEERESPTHQQLCVCSVRTTDTGIERGHSPSFIPFDPFEKVGRGDEEKNQTELKIAEPFLIRRRLCRCRIMYTNTQGLSSS